LNRLIGKVALVTGGASGLGRAIGKTFADEGAKVLISDVQVDQGLCAARDHGFTFLRQDVRDEEQWSDVLSQIRRTHGGLHILANSAGLLSSTDGDIDRAKMEEWRRIFSVNVEGVFLGCRAALPLIHASGGGSIINISSIAGLLATPFAVAYGASKAAVTQLTKSVAQYCAEKRLRVTCNSIHPGIVMTPPMEAHARKTAAEQNLPLDVVMGKLRSAVPTAELVNPDDVAAAAVFLASSEARHISGTQLVIDGGMVSCDTYFNTELTGRRA
jgi:3(or 17)beta-hydroxysteroid dehydrogenase